MIAPWPFAYVEGRTKSAKPPRTRNGAFGFFRGCDVANAFSETVAQILVSLPTLPQLEACGALAHAGRRSACEEVHVRELHTCGVGTQLGYFGYQVGVKVDSTTCAGICPRRPCQQWEGLRERLNRTVVDDYREGALFRHLDKVRLECVPR